MSEVSILSSEMLGNLDQEGLVDIASQVRGLMQQHPEELMVREVDEIIEMIQSGNALVLVGERNDVQGFVRLNWLYPEGEDNRAICEIGSLVVKDKGSGSGRLIFVSAIVLARERDSEAAILVVTSNKTTEQQSRVEKLVSLGAKVLETEEIPTCLASYWSTRENPAFRDDVVLDITEIRFE